MSLERLARIVALAVIIAIGIFNLYQAAIGWTLSDAGAYWEAAMRLRDGQPLYPPLASVDASDVYRYSPWFAWLAVPWTFLPMWLAATLWSAVLVAASGVALLPLVRERAWVLVALFAPILVGISAVGNVQPLIVAVLVHTLERRGGPLWVAVTASLKIFPVLFALVWIGRGQWVRAGIAAVATAVLWAPAALYDLRNYPRDAGQAAGLFAVPALYSVVVLAGAAAVLLLARSRFGWLAGGVAVVTALPRIFVYDVTFLMPGAQFALRRHPSLSDSRLARSME